MLVCLAIIVVYLAHIILGKLDTMHPTKPAVTYIQARNSVLSDNTLKQLNTLLSSCTGNMASVWTIEQIIHS